MPWNRRPARPALLGAACGRAGRCRGRSAGRRPLVGGAPSPGPDSRRHRRLRAAGSGTRCPPAPCAVCSCSCRSWKVSSSTRPFSWRICSSSCVDAADRRWPAPPGSSPAGSGARSAACAPAAPCDGDGKRHAAPINFEHMKHDCVQTPAISADHGPVTTDFVALSGKFDKTLSAPRLKRQKSGRSRLLIVDVLPRPSAAGAAQHGDGAAVLRPAGNVVADRDRPFLAVGDGAGCALAGTPRETR